MENKIVQKTFDEWTSGLNPDTARIRIFNNIRDIPYYILLDLRNPLNGPEDLLTKKKGSCSPKHFLLGSMFEKLGIPVKYVTYPFLWNEQKVDYPPDLKTMVKTLPTEHHIAIKAYMNDKWTLVDATWDIPIGAAGFPINTSWDGSSETKLAVTALDEIEHESAAARQTYVEKMTSSWSQKDHEQLVVFVERFNNWLESVRLK